MAPDEILELPFTSTQKEKAKIIKLREDNEKLRKLIQGKQRELDHMNLVASRYHRLYEELKVPSDKEMQEREREKKYPTKIYYSKYCDKVYKIDMDVLKEYKNEKEKEEEEEENEIDYSKFEEGEDDVNVQVDDTNHNHLIAECYNLQMESDIITNRIKELEKQLRRVQSKQIVLIREKAKTMEDL